MRRTFSLVVAACKNNGIGKDGKLPWSLPGDMAHFKRVTSHTIDDSKQNAVIMGRKTWNSIPEKFRPLPKRLNVILSREVASTSDAIRHVPNTLVCNSLDTALTLLAQPPYTTSVERVFVIGGGQIYNEAVQHSACDTIEMTHVDAAVDCDTFFPPIDAAIFQPSNVSETFTENNLPYRFATYVKKRAVVDVTETKSASAGNVVNPEEQQYLDLIRDIIDSGVRKADRTGTGTISKFGCQMRFSLRNGAFPLLTTKRVFFRGVAEELLWFVAGKTNGKLLLDKGIKIWEANGSRAYLDSINLKQREEHDLGPVYGFQWRHFGAEYTTMHADYTGKGVDQLAQCINTIKTKPDDRRIILSAWNPADLTKMALPPCHMFCQFYVANGELSCQMYQRSCDMGLGVPFNIASYSLLTCMMAQVCGLKPGEFIHVLGDAHVYTNHVEPLKIQLNRAPRAFPTLKINPAVKDIDGFRYEDFEVVGYEPHAKIDMEMSV